MKSNMNIENLEDKINYKFNDKNILIKAITHSSFDKNNYENLEFLGDSILGFVVAEYLFKNFDFNEGSLSKTRAKIVSASNLCKVANNLGIKDFLRLGNSFKNMAISNNILADCVESIIAGIYLDSNILNAQKFILNHIVVSYENITNIVNSTIDYKTQLQEKFQKDGVCKIEYITISQEGKSNNSIFTVELKINDKVLTTQNGKSKHEAEQKCAMAVLSNKN